MPQRRNHSADLFLSRHSISYVTTENRATRGGNQPTNGWKPGNLRRKRSPPWWPVGCSKERKKSKNISVRLWMPGRVWLGFYRCPWAERSVGRSRWYGPTTNGFHLLLSFFSVLGFEESTITNGGVAATPTPPTPHPNPPAKSSSAAATSRGGPVEAFAAPNRGGAASARPGGRLRRSAWAPPTGQAASQPQPLLTSCAAATAHGLVAGHPQFEWQAIGSARLHPAWTAAVLALCSQVAPPLPCRKLNQDVPVGNRRRWRVEWNSGTGGGGSGTLPLQSFSSCLVN